MSEQSNSKRIAKNTLMLYFRQILIMIVSLYTVRVVLNTLGAEDYGIYNVVAGVVTMFSFLSSSLASSFQRYLTFDLAHDNTNKLKETFALGLGVFILLGGIVFVFFETIGLWFVCNKLIIPNERLWAAICVYQASVVSFVILLYLAPYQAMLLASENMSVYAYTSVVEVVLKLVIVFVLKFIPLDKLLIYGILLFFVPVANILMYIGYCLKKYPMIRVSPKICWKRQKELITYTTWNLFGSMVPAIRNQGINILINMFYSPVINAARGIAYQVNNALLSFSSNFSLALRPQIIKQYAINEKEKSINLAFKGCRFCFFLLWIFVLPLYQNMEYVLGLWLVNVPVYTVLFTKLVLIDSLIECIAYPLVALMHANGRLKEYQLTVGIIQLFNIPLSYIFLKMGYSVQSTMLIAIILSFVTIIARLVVLKTLVQLSLWKFVNNVFIEIIAVTLFSTILSFRVKSFFSGDSFLIFCVNVLFCVIINLFCIYIFGLKKLEKYQILKNIKEKIHLKEN